MILSFINRKISPYLYFIERKQEMPYLCFIDIYFHIYVPLKETAKCSYLYFRARNSHIYISLTESEKSSDLYLIYREKDIVRFILYIQRARYCQIYTLLIESDKLWYLYSIYSEWEIAIFIEIVTWNKRNIVIFVKYTICLSNKINVVLALYDVMTVICVCGGGGGASSGTCYPSDVIYSLYRVLAPMFILGGRLS